MYYLKKRRLRQVETLKRGALVRKYLKHGIELGDLQKIFDFLRQVQQLQIPTLVLYSSEPAEPLAVNIVHVREIQKNQLPIIVQKSPNCRSH